ncbi:MAG: response regulator transcription factor [SAR202 cluster bacterium]|jgi:DNA-binding response OmpR family regulator|nr:response regulator transcription factor [SAR202 cluster bacterium]
MQGRDHILIIEDDPAVGESLRDSLTSNGFQAEWKSSGGEGIRHAQSESPDLVILDVRLPDGSGFDFCRQMRQMRLRQPILMLTARREEADKILGLEMGADDYLTKPYSASELLARVRALLRRAYGELASEDDNILYAGDLVIDRGRGQVSRGIRILNVTPTEFRMLVYLAQNAGQVVSRGQILDAVWGYDADTQSERAVNVHIRRLREKVEPDPSRPTIVLTAPGLGYRLSG